MPEVDDKLFERIFEIQRADSESEVKVPITWLVYGLSNLYSISSPEWIYHIKRTAEAAENSFVRYPTFTDIILDSPPNIPEKSSPDLASKSLDDQTPAEVLAGAMIAAYVSISDGDYLFARDTISDARSAIDGKKEEYPTEEVKSALAVADFVKSELFLRMEGDQNLQISFNSINDSVDIYQTTTSSKHN